jgi:ATP-dependent helicase/nuclease subunit A
VRFSRRLHVSGDLPVRAVSAVTLTDEQALAVVRRSEPLLLAAAAGSGKTSVLVERFVAAVREDGVAPARILAITFTERAAGELRARVRARLLELGERDAARDTEAAFVGTFHGFCARVLRAHSLAAGLDPGFAILDDGLAGRLREQAFAGALREFLDGEGTDAVDLLAAYGVDRVGAMLAHVHAELRSRGQRLPRLPQLDAQREGARECWLLDRLLCSFALAYERLKHARRAVDFDDLELLTRELLNERAALRAAWSERFELLMVDEFQDTNRRQLGILAALDRGNLFTVGDELQSIYGFRHADVSLFRERRDELEGRGASLRLTRNFRSRAALLEVVNAVFAERFSGYSPLLGGREETPGEPPAQAPADEGAQPSAVPEAELLLTDLRGWERNEDLLARLAAGLPQAQPWRQAEARMLAQRVAELIDSGQACAGEVVVLVRAVGDLDVFERALQLRGLRTLAAVGSFWGHQQIAELIAYLRALANPLDEQALYSALASPLAGCSLDCLALIAQAARESGRGAWASALAADELLLELPDGDRQALSSFCAWLQREREQSPLRAIARLIERAIEWGGYREHVLALDWAERRLANVHKLLRLARRFEAAEGRDLRAFLDHVEYLQRAATSEPDAPVEGAEPDAVRLMTIHAAKGLEFPVVCVADLGRQPNTQTPDLLIDGDRVGLRLVTLDGGGSSPVLDYEQLCAERRVLEAQEEDRILYVAMTRARDRLLLSGAVDFARWPVPRQLSTPISWLVPALSAELPALAAAHAGDAPAHDVPIDAAGSIVVRCRLNSPASVGVVLRLDHDEPDETPHAVAGEQLSLCLDGAPSSIPANPSVDTMATHASDEEHPTGDPRPPAEASLPGQRYVPDEVLPPVLSYTSLSELERCGYRYYLQRVLGLPEERQAASGAADGRRGLEARARGILIHRLMEDWDFARPSPPAPEQVAQRARGLGLRVGRAERQEIAGLLANAAAAVPVGRVAAAANVRREHHFAFSLDADTPLLSGVIDLLALEADGGWLIVDYKSDRVGAQEDLEALVEREYAIQRELYALALLRDGAPSVEVLHWFFERPAEWVSTHYAQHDRERLQDRLRARLAAAAGRAFAVSPNPHRALCLSCPGRAGLCSWSDAETLRENPMLSL